MMRLTLKLFVVLAMVLVVAAFGHDVKASDEKLIKIGASLPLSGFAAPWGLQSLRSLEMLVERANNAGGYRFQ